MIQMQVSIPDPKPIGQKIWEVSISPSEVRRLHDSANNLGTASVLILSAEPSVEAGVIKFNLDDVAVVNVGSTNRALVIDGTKPVSFLDRFRERKVEETKLSDGDNVFLNRLNSLPQGVREAGRLLLTEVRKHFRGELRPVSESRFQETPDNFWFVTVQPRAESILVTVRGLPDRFQPSSLKILEDRRPYSRFKVRSVADVPEAARIVTGAIRRVR